MDDDALDKHRGSMPHPRTRLWYLLPIFFGVLVVIAIAIIPESIYSRNSTIISEEISKKPLQVYEINTECELLAAILNHEFDLPITELSKSFPDEANEAQQILDEIQINNGNATQEQESKIKVLFFSMIMKYFSINPDLKDSLYYMNEYPRDSLAWIDRIDPIFSKCNLTFR